MSAVIRIFQPPLILLLWLAAGAAALQGDEPALTPIGEVRSLPVAEARKEQLVRIKGVVIYVERYGIMVQDDTGSTFFRPTEQQMFLKVGDEVEVRGRTQMGRYVAGLGASEVRVLRRGLTAPAIAAGHDDIVSARYFYQRVAVDGIVRSIHVKEDWTSLRLAMGSRILEVRFVPMPPPGLELVDARVRLKGLSAGSINDRRQVVETFIRMQSWDDIEVLDPPIPAGQIPRVAAGELLAFRPAGQPERRLAVAGTISAVFPDGEIYLEDSTVAFAANLSQPAALSLGDRVELVGYAAVFQFAASVVDAEVRSRQPGPEPRPVAVSSPDLLDSSHDGRLVAVDGNVTDAFKTLVGYTLVLAGNQRTIQVSVSGDKAPPEAGSVVRVTGICHVEVAPSPEFVRRAGAIALRSRAPGDVTVLEAPRWWTPRKLVMALGVLAGVILVAGIWNVLLHRQVRRKTAALRDHIESEAALQERQRIAQEFHDTLEQDLTGLGLRLDTAATLAFDEGGRNIMASSRSLLARIQAETKNIVSNLRDSAPVETDLAGTLESVVGAHADADAVEVRGQFDRPLPRLAANTLHHVHMMVREGVNNALKHARAGLILVHARVEAGRLVLSVTDNGRGFDAERDTWGKSGHFGCIGIRERARKIGAVVAWRAVPGGGTAVEISLPLDSSGAVAVVRKAGQPTGAPVAR